MQDKEIRRAAVLTDLSSLGNCSGSAAISVLSALAVEPCLIPTAILSAQTGFSDYAFVPMSEKACELVSSLCGIAPCIDAVYIGFLPDGASCRAAEMLIDHFGKSAPVLIDPITGDRGRRFDFLDQAAFDRIAALCRRADILTPNITELCLLSGGDYASLTKLSGEWFFDEVAALCARLTQEREQTIIVTGIDGGEVLSNFVYDNRGYTVVSAKRFGGSMSGTGDIFASFICAAAAKGESITRAAESAGEFISSVMSREAGRITDRNYGIPFQKYLSEFFLNK